MPVLQPCLTCAGSDALISDLEELAPFAGVSFEPSGCLGRCGSGPNCLVVGALASQKQARISNEYPA